MWLRALRLYVMVGPGRFSVQTLSGDAFGCPIPHLSGHHSVRAPHRVGWAFEGQPGGHLTHRMQLADTESLLAVINLLAAVKAF